MKYRKGFTLIELLVVIAIIAILAALLLPAIFGAKCQSKAGVGKSTIRDLESSLNAYDESYGSFPPSDPGFTSNPLVNFLMDIPFRTGLKPFYLFKEGQLDQRSRRFYNPVGAVGDPNYEYRYKENKSRGYSARNPPPPGDPPVGVRNPSTFDIWSAGCRRNPIVPTELNNWGN